MSGFSRLPCGLVQSLKPSDLRFLRRLDRRRSIWPLSGLHSILTIHIEGMRLIATRTPVSVSMISVIPCTKRGGPQGKRAFWKEYRALTVQPKTRGRLAVAVHCMIFFSLFSIRLLRASSVLVAVQSTRCPRCGSLEGANRARTRPTRRELLLRVGLALSPTRGCSWRAAGGLRVGSADTR